MSVDERIALALADFRAVARLGIPELVYTDGGSGIRGARGVTAFPVCLALAATFDPVLAHAYGAAIGSEARALGRNVLLGPLADIARVPIGGRLPETLGEDPWLIGELGSEYVRGVQSKRVVAMVKHLVANNFETNRSGEGLPSARREAVDVHIDAKALHEVYLAPFRRLLVSAGAWSVMGSYNRLNGEYTCQSRVLFDTVKRIWGWPGFVAPDFMFGVRDPLLATQAGLDIPGLDGAAGRTRDMFHSGDVPDERLHDIVRRILRAMFSAGLFDYPAAPSAGPVSTPTHVATAQAVAVDGAVLLRNRGALLPLDASVARGIAVIGPASDDAIYVVGGSGGVSLDRGRRVTPLEGIRARAGDHLEVVHAQGSWGDVRLPAVPGLAFEPPGVLAEYFVGRGFDSQPVRRAENGIDCAGPPAGIVGEWSARWTGRLVPHNDGRHRFSITFAGRVSLFVDGHEIASGSREAVRLIEGPELPLQATADLRAGTPVDVRLEYTYGPALHAPDLGLVPSVQLGWQEPDDMLDEAVRVAADNDVAIVVVQATSGEGMDRCSLALPGDQDQLVHRVAEANPNTVVVLNTPGPTLMPWLSEVRAVVQVWYPGQQFGAALASVLFGDSDPGGRLPVTFPADAVQGPLSTLEQYPGVNGVVRYDEGVFVGYRYYDAHDQEPLFPFGFGLSYATFDYSDLRLTVDAERGIVALAVTVANEGIRAGTEVVQAYVSWPDAAGQPHRQLRGIAKVRIDPGQSATVHCDLPLVGLGIFSSEYATEIVQDGMYLVAVGRSSRDLRLSGQFQVLGGKLCQR